MLDYRRLSIATLVLATALPVTAQPPRPRGERPQGETPAPSATELLNARRALRLSPRQVARLDSLERREFASRDELRQRMMAQRDSLCGGARPCRLTTEQREQARARFDAALPQRQAAWRRDSVGRASAWALLDSTQRGQVMGMRMARRMEGRQSFGPGGRRGAMNRPSAGRRPDARGGARGGSFGPGQQRRRLEAPDAPPAPMGPGARGPRGRPRPPMPPADTTQQK